MIWHFEMWFLLASANLRLNCLSERIIDSISMYECVFACFFGIQTVGDVVIKLEKSPKMKSPTALNELCELRNGRQKWGLARLSLENVSDFRLKQQTNVLNT